MSVSTPRNSVSILLRSAFHSFDRTFTKTEGDLKLQDAKATAEARAWEKQEVERQSREALLLEQRKVATELRRLEEQAEAAEAARRLAADEVEQQRCAAEAEWRAAAEERGQRDILRACVGQAHRDIALAHRAVRSEESIDEETQGFEENI